MDIQPLGDRVMVERDAAEGVTKGGIVLPDVVQDRPQRGTVLAVGPGRVTSDGQRRPIGVSVGDSVLFTRHAGDEFKLDGSRKVMLVRVEDLLAVVTA
jgi:chaperonin GroES